MQTNTLVMLGVAFISALTVGTILCLHGLIPASAVMTIVTSGLTGAFAIAEPGSAGRKAGTDAPNGASSRDSERS